jgi:hypothetical protein
MFKNTARISDGESGLPTGGAIEAEAFMLVLESPGDGCGLSEIAEWVARVAENEVEEDGVK